MSTVGVVADLHEPFTHPFYRKWVCGKFREWGVDTVVMIGDVVDNHAISRYSRSPLALSPLDEYRAAKDQVAKWRRVFKDYPVFVTIGNHDERVLRQAASVDIPATHLRTHADLWGTPEWDWVKQVTIDGVTYIHGDGWAGEHHAYNAAKKTGKKLVMGHVHSAAGFKIVPGTPHWGMNVGHGIDQDTYAFDYEKRNELLRSPCSCGIVEDGQPHLLFMGS